MAAGCSRRFIHNGGRGNKLNALFENQTVFATTLSNVLATGLAVHVVTRPENILVQAACQALQVPYSALESQGLGDSIAAGVAATPDWSGWLIHLADMPFVPPTVFSEVASLLEQHAIVRPFYLGVPGHPVGFSGQWRDQLLRLSGESGAQSLFARHSVYQWASGTAAVIKDIDVPWHLPDGA